MKFINNLIDFARSGFSMGMTHNGDRDTWSIFGYPDTLTIKDFRDKYRRGDIATRIVDAYPNACWSNIPSIVEDDEEQEVTPWEKSVNYLMKSLDFWKNIRKLDKLINLGSYAVLYIGFADGKNLSEPITKGAKPIFIKPLAEDVATIKTTVVDLTDKRYGLPLLYTLTIKGGQSVDVHYSRVIHVAERTLDDETIGQGILYHIWNKLIDLEKISGGSAEVFWLNARAGIALEAESDADLGDETDKEKLATEIDNYQHNLKRFIRTKGFVVKPLNVTVTSPKDQFDICISLIAGSTAIPKRILLGNEAGELASSQDENNWNNQIKDRQSNFCEPRILNRFVDYMIELGILDALDEDKVYGWEWPSLVTLSEKDKATIATSKASAIATYANSPTAETLIPPQQFVEEILEMKYREDVINKMIEEENAAIDKSLLEQSNAENSDAN